MQIADTNPTKSRRPLLFRNVSDEGVLITFLCLLDLITTLYWVSQGQAREGNPVLAFYLDQGHIPFIGVKLFMFVPSVIMAEWYRAHNPTLITRVMRWVCVGYIFIYVSGVFSHQGRVLDFYKRWLFASLG